MESDSSRFPIAHVRRTCYNGHRDRREKGKTVNNYRLTFKDENGKGTTIFPARAHSEIEALRKVRKVYNLGDKKFLSKVEVV